MKRFDESYTLLSDMRNDEYFPVFLVDKIEALIKEVIALLESGESELGKVQAALDRMTIGINDLQEEFEENDSEIETAARDSIGETVEYVLKWFDIDIDIETAIGERDW